MKSIDMWTMIKRLSKMSNEQLVKVFHLESQEMIPEDIMRYALDKYSADQIDTLIKEFDKLFTFNPGDEVYVDGDKNTLFVITCSKLDGEDMCHIISEYDGSGFGIETYRCSKTNVHYNLPWLSTPIEEQNSDEDDFLNREMEKVGQQSSSGFEEGVMNLPVENDMQHEYITSNLDPFDLFC